MKHHFSASFAATGFALVGLLVTGSAAAHISLEKGGSHLSRDGDANLKEAPCGLAGSKRGTTNVYTYAPGETIEVKLIETIPHPSYFRIAFDKDGDDGFLEPKSIKPIDPTRACPFNAADQCGESDFNNSPEVLMDNLDPHLSSGKFGTPFSWQVTLPNVTCDNCTLQVMQVMQDTVHGAYNPDPTIEPKGTYVADNYHQCIDMVLAGDVAPSDDGGNGTGRAKTAAPASNDSGGCSVGAARRGSAPPAWYAALFGLAWLRVARGSRARRPRAG